MTSNWRHRYRVWFRAAKGTAESQDVTAQSVEGAERTARKARLMLGFRGWDAKPTRTEDMGHIGTDAAYCPLCTKPAELFEAAVPELTPRPH